VKPADASEDDDIPLQKLVPLAHDVVRVTLGAMLRFLKLFLPNFFAKKWDFLHNACKKMIIALMFDNITRGEFVNERLNANFVPRRQLSWAPPLARCELFCRREEQFKKLPTGMFYTL
jgi:hypothetical protein